MVLTKEIREAVYWEALSDAQKHGDYPGAEFITRQLQRLGVLPAPTPTKVKEKK